MGPNKSKTVADNKSAMKHPSESDLDPLKRHTKDEWVWSHTVFGVPHLKSKLLPVSKLHSKTGACHTIDNGLTLDVVESLLMKWILETNFNPCI